MEYKDYYAILGVPRNADSASIKRAFRGLARQLHPDVNPGNREAEQRFKDVSEAYDVLGSEEKRQLYDRLGSQWRMGRGSAGFDWSSYFDEQEGDESQDSGRRYRKNSRREEPPIDAPGAESGFSDFFQQLFNERPSRRREPRVRVYETGPGFSSPNTPGSNFSGPFSGPEQTLPIEISLEESFWGATRTVQQGGSRFDVTIPRGMQTGSKVRVSTGTGDMLLVVNVKPHPTFTPDGANLRSTLAVDLYSALLGGEIRVPTLEGNLALVIPANTQNGRIFRLRGQGLPTIHNPEERGDLLVEVSVELPLPLGEEERRLFAQLRRLRPSTGNRL